MNQNQARVSILISEKANFILKLLRNTNKITHREPSVKRVK